MLIVFRCKNATDSYFTRDDADKIIKFCPDTIVIQIRYRKETTYSWEHIVVTLEEAYPIKVGQFGQLYVLPVPLPFD